MLVCEALNVVASSASRWSSVRISAALSLCLNENGANRVTGGSTEESPVRPLMSLRLVLGAHMKPSKQLLVTSTCVLTPPHSNPAVAEQLARFHQLLKSEIRSPSRPSLLKILSPRSIFNPILSSQVLHTGVLQVNNDRQVLLAPAAALKCAACVLLQVRSSCCPSEGSSACCVKTFMETPSVQKSTSPHTLTMRNTRYLPERRILTERLRGCRSLGLTGGKPL